jgi:hypothetical protein
MTACAGAGEVQTFYFDSNVNVIVTSDNPYGTADKSCTTPCQLDIEMGFYDDVRFSVSNPTYFQEKKIESDAYFSDGERYSEFRGPLDKFAFFNFQLVEVQSEVGMITSSVPSTTTALVIWPTDSSSAIAHSANAIYYDTNSYYIYASNDVSYIFGDYEFVSYALRNFEAMQAELFVTEQPFIAAFAEMTGLPNIADLLQSSDSPIRFLDLLTLTKLKLILESEQDEQDKIDAVSAFLNYSKPAIKRLYNEDKTKFIKNINNYLEEKRQFLTNPTYFIEISYTELKEIGINSRYPLDASYKLIDSGTLTGMWQPIGCSDRDCRYQGTGFSGKFDGNGQTITIEQLSDKTGYAGLFAKIEDAVIENLTIDIQTQKIHHKNDNDKFRIGALAGVISGSTIKNVHIIGNELNVNIDGDLFVGGLAGELYGDVIGSSVKLNVTTNAVRAGGFAGYAMADFLNSFYRGDVKGAVVAAFAGESRDGTSIINCYSAGNLTSTTYISADKRVNLLLSVAAGFIARVDVIADNINITGSVIIDGTISGNKRNYGIGHVYGDVNVNISSSKISSAVVLGEGDLAEDIMNRDGIDKSFGLEITTSDMADQNTFINEFGWDFTNIWEMGSQYPELR